MLGKAVKETKFWSYIQNIDPFDGRPRAVKSGDIAQCFQKYYEELFNISLINSLRVSNLPFSHLKNKKYIADSGHPQLSLDAKIFCLSALVNTAT